MSTRAFKRLRRRARRHGLELDDAGRLIIPGGRVDDVLALFDALDALARIA